MTKNKQNFEIEKKKKFPFNVFSKKGLMTLALAGVMIASPLMLAGCSDGKDGQNGADGTIWKSGTSYTEFTDAKVGDYFIDTDDFILYQKSADSWTIVMENYGKPSTTPQAPSPPVITINQDGYWCVDGTSTGVKARGEDGTPGTTPKVEIKDGYWYINDVKSVKAEATDGHTPVITINGDGFWCVDGTPTTTKATPSAITIVGGYWYIDGETTGVKAEGKDGAIWLTGTAITGTGTGISATIANSKVGDLYFNTDTCDIYQCTAENTWNWIANIKGDKGEDRIVYGEITNYQEYYLLDDANLSIKNVSFLNGLAISTTSNSSGTVSFENCKIYLNDGTGTLTNNSLENHKTDNGLVISANSANVSYVFKNCIFTADDNHIYTRSSSYNAYIFGNYSADSITFENCTFERSGKHGIGCSYAEGGSYYNLIVTGCNFVNWNNNADNGAAIRGNVTETVLETKTINISNNIFGNNNESTQQNVAIDGWSGNWS